ncbi:hypothetical protein [Pseudonocardia kunmingensis]|uniref:hypothetical protein n=1 Tax=Pseudonocardia kunmingensis TaxID=630975 RepID=UPI001150555F|nr:hypothetical protein [Pseudonocardia kunmingensis]
MVGTPITQRPRSENQRIVPSSAMATLDQLVELRVLRRTQPSKHRVALAGRRTQHVVQRHRRHVVHPVEREDRGDPVVEGRRARGQHPAHADPEQPDPVGPHVRTGGGEVDHRADYVLPVRAERQPELADHLALPRALEGEYVVAALLPGGARPWTRSPRRYRRTR